MIFGLLGGSGAILGTPKGTCWGQNLKLLDFDPTKLVRGVFASILGAWLTGGVKTVILGLLGSSGAILSTPKGTCWGQNLKLLNFDPRKQVSSKLPLIRPLK